MDKICFVRGVVPHESCCSECIHEIGGCLNECVKDLELPPIPDY